MSVTPAIAALPGARAFPSSPAGLGLRGSRTPLQVVIGGPDYESVQEWSDAILQRVQENPGLLNLGDRLRAQPAAVRRPDRSAQGRRSRHRGRDHRPDAADHARVARDHHLRRSRPRISGDRAGAGGRPPDPDRSRQHLRARREQRRAGAAHGPGPTGRGRCGAGAASLRPAALGHHLGCARQ